MNDSIEHAEQEFRQNSGLERIIFFSDAVIAIAITLLAIDIKPPDVEPSQLATAMAELSPKFASFTLSFMIIASFWVMHHITFSYIRDYDYRLAWLNILFLLFIALTPFASSMLGSYMFDETALIVYSFVIAMAGFARASIWEYAVRGHRLIDRGLSKDLVRKVRIRNLLAPVAFGVSIPLVAINIVFVGIWVVVPVSIMIFRKLPKGR